jgi:acyl-lipid omega-6 desaturase (Delta-12 desaturase)
MSPRPAPSPLPAELLARIPAGARRRRHFPALAVFAADYAGYLLLVAGACVLPGWWAKALCVLAAGGMIGGLYVVGHDAGHGVLVPGRRLNRWLARLAFLPAYAPLAAWFRAHVLLHHNFLRVRGRDMAWMPWTVAEYRRASAARRAWYRFLRTPPGLSFYWTVGNWVPYLLFPPGSELGARRPQFRLDRLLVLGFAAGLFAALLALTRAAAAWPWADPVGPAGAALLGLVAPYLVWTYLIGLMDLLHHTHPRAVCFADREEWDYYTANVRSTTHLVLPLGLNRLMHNLLEHTAHHVDPRVPLFHLPAAQARLEAAYPGDVPVERLTPGYVLRILRTCRLYDYDRRQWLDYDGTPTSPPQRPAGAGAAPEAAAIAALAGGGPGG